MIANGTRTSVSGKTRYSSSAIDQLHDSVNFWHDFGALTALKVSADLYCSATYIVMVAIGWTMLSSRQVCEVLLIVLQRRRQALGLIFLNFGAHYFLEISLCAH